MDTNQPVFSSVPGPPSPAAKVLSTNIPSAVTLAVALALFLLPFFEINFANIFSLQNSGFGIAAGTDWDMSGIFGRVPGGSLHLEHVGKYGPNIYAIVALLLALAAFILSLSKMRIHQRIAMVLSIFTAALLIGLWLDLRQSMNFSAINDNKADIFTLRFQPTPWYYVAVIASLAGAFFCYKRIELTRQ